MTTTTPEPIEGYLAELGDVAAHVEAHVRAAFAAGWKAAKTRRPAAKRTPRAYPARPPRLTDRQYVDVSSRWARACEDPEHWRLKLAADAAYATGRGGSPGAVFRAWGLDPVTGR